jgi:hypothetical protein
VRAAGQACDRNECKFGDDASVLVWLWLSGRSAQAAEALVLGREPEPQARAACLTGLANGVPHTWWMYGRPGPAAPFGCDGGHNFSCWNFAFRDALPRIMGALQPAA